ncbi:uncharacterized protein sS8_4240 [Methylocaldum marinum]|uniref:DUF58 domain-containing protein n=1 Tax=Methylocaldum marinum TaxID=1432792 RepID=A0A250KWZ2_9GAMM|nr:DUF58 domain-containing protein [Methylocaldum marinum]BBA36170.1 uncharacterized protein sS8_4240 [Methylocaldum marinum]
MNASLEARIERGLAALHLGVALPATALVLLLIAWNRGIALLYGLLALVLATWVIAHLAPLRHLLGIEARRRHPPSVHEGEPLPLTVELRHAGRGARYLLEVVDRVPCAPEEEQQPSGFIERLRERAKLELQASCDCRGTYTLGPLRLRTGYPLGIRWRELELPGTESELLVYPAPFPIRRLKWLDASLTPVLGSRAVAVKGGDESFFGLRDYQRGDSPRYIDWRSTARLSRLLVKEHEVLASSELMIVLDLNREHQAGEGRESMLEYAVKIAASIARFALGEGHGVGLLGVGKSIYRVAPGRGWGHNQSILDVLARVQAEGSAPYAEAVEHATASLPRGGLMVLFDHGTEVTLDQTLSVRLSGRRVTPGWVCFDRHSFDFPMSRDPRSEASLRSGIYHVRRGDDLGKVFAT